MGPADDIQQTDIVSETNFLVFSQNMFLSSELVFT